MSYNPGNQIGTAWICIYAKYTEGLALDHKNDIRVERGVEDVSQCLRTRLRAWHSRVPEGLHKENGKQVIDLVLF